MAQVAFAIVNLCSVALGFIFVVLGSLSADNPSALYKPRDILMSLGDILQCFETIGDLSVSSALVKAAVIFVVIGLLLIFMGCLGLHGIKTGNPYLLIAFSILSLIITTLNIALAVYSYMNADLIKTRVSDALQLGIDRDYRTGMRFSADSVMLPTDPKELAWDNLQTGTLCCGALGDDWSEAMRWNDTYVLPHGATVQQAQRPPSCCPRTSSGKQKTRIGDIHVDDYEDIGTCLQEDSTDAKGCSNIIDDVMRNMQTTVGCSLLIAILLQGLCVLLACCMRTVTDKENKITTM